MPTNGGDIVVTLTLEDGDFKVGINTAGKQAEQFARRIRSIDHSVARTERRVRGFTSTLRDWTLILGQARNAVNQLYFIMGDWIRRIIDANREVERLTFLMKGLSGAATEAGRMKDATSTIKELFSLAKTAPFEVKALADTFVKMKSVGIDPLAGSLQALTDGVAAFGGTNDIMKRASIAVQQMAGKGVISMEELRQQMGEAVPRSIELMARSMGLSFGALVKEISLGTVEAKHALAAMFGEFDRVFGGRALAMMDTFNGQWSKMITNLTQLSAQTPGMEAFFDAVTQSLKDINTFLASPQAKVFAEDLGQALSSVLKFMTSVVRAFFEWRGVIVNVGKALLVAFGGRLLFGVFGRLRTSLGALRTAFRDQHTALLNANAASRAGIPVMGGLVGQYQRLGPVARTASFAVRGLGLAMTSLLGPIGWAVTAIFSLIQALDLFGSSHAKVLAQIAKGELITNSDQIEERTEAIKKERTELERLEAAEAKQANRVKVGRERYGLDEDDPRLVRVKNKHQAAKQAADEARASLNELETKLRDSVTVFEEFRTDGLAENMMSPLRKELTTFSSEFDAAMREIMDTTESRSKERIEATVRAQEDLYSKSIGLHESFIADQRDRLQGATEADAAAIEKTIATANKRIVDLQKRQEDGAAAARAGLLLVSNQSSGSGSGGGAGVDTVVQKILSAQKRFATAAGKILDDSARLTQRLMDPLAFTMPKAVDQLRTRLSGTLEPLRQLAPESRRAAEALALLESQIGDLVDRQSENEVARIMVAMRERTKEIKRGLMREDKAREAAFQDEVTRLTNMRDVLEEQGLWRLEYEEWLQDQIQALREKTDRENETSMERWLRSWETFGRDMKNLLGDTFSSLSGLLADWITDGELKLADFARNMLNTFMDIAINAGLAALASGSGGGGFLSSILGAIGGLFGGGGGGQSIAPHPQYGSIVLHGGGIVGSGSGMSRHGVDPSMFAGAPRFHTGGVVGSDEMPAILKKKEGVFTPEQMKAIGAGMGGNNVQVNVINNTDREVQAEQGRPRFDGKQMILDVVLTAASRPGGFRDSLKGALK